MIEMVLFICYIMAGATAPVCSSGVHNKLFDDFDACHAYRVVALTALHEEAAEKDIKIVGHVGLTCRRTDLRPAVPDPTATRV